MPRSRTRSNIFIIFNLLATLKHLLKWHMATWPGSGSLGCDVMPEKEMAVASILTSHSEPTWLYT